MESVETFLRDGRFKHLLDVKLADICSKYDLKRLEVELIYYLSDCGEKDTASDIRKVLYVNKGHLSCMLAELCDRGFIDCSQDENDRRYIHYSLTEKAAKVNDAMHEEWQDLLSQLLTGITEEEIRTYKRLAKKIRDNIDRMLEE